MVSFLSILIASVYTGVRQYRMFKDPRLRGFSLAIFLGLLTYFVHGTLNNFLDTDKSSAIFWGFLAMQVVLDVFYLPGSEKTTAK
jgi:putative inorganic carbon (hco3(-)) transporter